MIPLLIGINVIGGTFGDVLCSAGMKRHGEFNGGGVRGTLYLCLEVLRNRYVLTGILAMIISFFALIALLSVTPLSFAVPATASSYILETALAKYILQEKVRWERWAGAALVTVGIVLLAI